MILRSQAALASHFFDFLVNLSTFDVANRFRCGGDAAGAMRRRRSGGHRNHYRLCRGMPSGQMSVNEAENDQAGSQAEVKVSCPSSAVR